MGRNPFSIPAPGCFHLSYIMENSSQKQLCPLPLLQFMKLRHTDKFPADHLRVGEDVPFPMKGRILPGCFHLGKAGGSKNRHYFFPLDFFRWRIRDAVFNLSDEMIILHTCRHGRVPANMSVCQDCSAKAAQKGASAAFHLCVPGQQ